jgi:putative tricarboxylic transport membrane protein
MGTEYLLEGLMVALQPGAILLLAGGLILGIVVGAAPGMGGTVGLTLMLPVALAMTPENAIMLFVAILVGASFGNSIPAVLLKVPGSASALLTAVEGYPFNQRGEAGRALLVCLVASVVGQLFSIFIFVLFVVPLAHIAIRLLYPEMFAIILLGLLAAAGLMNRSIVKGLIAVAFGLLLAQIGTDPVTGASRLTFGVDQLYTGLQLVPVIVGLLAVRQLLVSAGEIAQAPGKTGRPAFLKAKWLSREDRKAMRLPVLVGALLGTAIGAVPGAGGSIASFVSYDLAKRLSKDKSEFGRGTTVKGLAVVDSSNNSVIGGELIPTLGIGIPGAPPMVVLMAVLSAQGLIPGPHLLSSRPSLLAATFGGLIIATLLLMAIGYLFIGPSIYLSKISQAATLLVTSVLIVIGVYSLRWSMFDVWLALIMGVIGYFAEKHDYPVAPMALAFVLGGIMESSLRRGLIMSFGWEGFFTRPVTLGILTAALLTLVFSIIISRQPTPRGARHSDRSEE